MVKKILKFIITFFFLLILYWTCILIKGLSFGGAGILNFILYFDKFPFEGNNFLHNNIYLLNIFFYTIVIILFMMVIENGRTTHL